MLLSVKLFDTPTYYVSIYLHNYMDDYSYVYIFVVDSTLITFKEKHYQICHMFRLFWP